MFFFIQFLKLCHFFIYCFFLILDAYLRAFLELVKKKVMSWLWNPANWFRATAPAGPSMTDPADAIELAMNSMDALHSKRMHMLKKSSNLLKEAKEHKAAGDSKRAMACMKRKQQIDTITRQLEGQLLNLEKTSMMMESTATTVELAHTMKSGGDTIKSLLQDVSVGDIEDVADDLNEQMIDAHDLGEALSRPMGAQDDVDQEETILAEMQEWDMDARVDTLPDAPTFVNSNNDNNNGNSKLLVEETKKTAVEI